jgi:hypothetical protein
MLFNVEAWYSSAVIEYVLPLITEETMDLLF